jgi:hypothetical protein
VEEVRLGRDGECGWDRILSRVDKAEYPRRTSTYEESTRRRAATEKAVAAFFAFIVPRPGLWNYPRVGEEEDPLRHGYGRRGLGQSAEYWTWA